MKLYDNSVPHEPIEYGIHPIKGTWAVASNIKVAILIRVIIVSMTLHLSIKFKVILNYFEL